MRGRVLELPRSGEGPTPGHEAEGMRTCQNSRDMRCIREPGRGTLHYPLRGILRTDELMFRVLVHLIP